MPHISLVPTQKSTHVHLYVRSGSTAPVLFPYRVHCSALGCRWSCPARDVDDAIEVLTDHLHYEHAGAA